MKFKNLVWGLALAMFFTSCGGSEEQPEDTANCEPATCCSSESEDETASTTPATTDVSGEFSVDTEESKVAWVGVQRLKNKQHNGTIKFSSGSFTLESGVVTAGSFTVDMTTIENLDMAEMPEMKGKLEGHLKSADFFDVENYPEATFEVTSGEGTTATGSLTIRGNTEEATVTDITLEETEEGITATGKLTFDRSKFDVKYGSKSHFDDLGDNLIEDKINTTITLVASKSE